MRDWWRPGVVVPALVMLVVALVSGVVWLREASTGDGEEGDDAFRFAVIGDFGTGDQFEREVAAAVRAWVEVRPTDALVSTGDNVYENGEPEDFGEAWHEPYGWVQEQGLEVVASLGNHDVRHNDGKDVMELLDMPGPWYTTRLGAAEVIVLDANRPKDEEQKEWLAETLAASEASWQVAVFHQPVYSCSTHDSTVAVINNWLPLLHDGGVDLVLNGHDHNYQRFQDDTITYVVEGASGAELYRVSECEGDEPEQVAAHDDSRSFVTVEGDTDELRLAALDPEGDVVDEAVLTAGA